MAEELVGIIGGTGLGDALAEQITDAKLESVNTPFGGTSAPILVGAFGARRVAFLNRHGCGHRLCPSEIPFAANIFALKKLGVHAVIASGAVGSLREEIGPGDLVIVEQFIDKTLRRTSSFFGGYGAVHCEMGEPTCGRLGGILRVAAEAIETRTHSEATYVCMEGPQFSTRAESRMHRAWGGDLIGMTAMPEAKLAREAQMCYGLVALASDYDCWKPHDQSQNKRTVLEEIIANLRAATNNCLELIKALLSTGQSLVSEDCPCRHSLDMAVWTDPSAIEPAERERLAPLFE